MGSKVIVVGSYSAAVFFKGKSIPLKGETLIADSFFQSFGGKGSNQGVCAATLGADVRMVCKIGVDQYADEIIDLYKKLGMYSPSIMQDPNEPTSIGAIFIDQEGNNAIMINLGANKNLTSAEIIDWVKQEKDPFIVGFQLENSVETIMEAIEACGKMGVPVLLDPAPASKLDESVYKHITYLKPNEHEAKVLSGIEITKPEDAYAAGEWFIKKGVKTAIITLGEQGTVVVSKDGKQYFQAIQTEAADTTGAGDIFSGALMAAMSKGMPLDRAVCFATCAASISVTRMGVVGAIPTLEETQKLFDETYKEGGLR